MLFVSKSLDEDMYEVTDTTDEVSEVLSKDDIVKLVQRGLKIYKVHLTDDVKINTYDGVQGLIKQLRLRGMVLGLSNEKINLGDGIEIKIRDDTDVALVHSKMVLSFDGRRRAVVPSYVTRVEDFCFSPRRYTGEALEAVEIKHPLDSLGNRCFNDSIKLSEVHWHSVTSASDTPKSVGDDCFSDCPSLKVVVLPDGLVSIGNHAFDGCSSLPYIEIPDSVDYVGSHAFQGCINLTTIHLPYSLRSLERGCFYGCKRLRSITLPPELNTIANDVFVNAGLRSIVIPKHVERIGTGAFSYCESLTAATVLSPELDLTEFFLSKSLRRLRVTKALYAYDSRLKQAKDWGIRVEIID